MSNLRWLRLHNEIIDDPKMRRLTIEERWVWIVCLCLAQRSPLRGSLMLTRTEPLSIGDITAAADLLLDEHINPITLVTDALNHFEALEMVITENGVVRLTNYSKRQYDKPSNAPEETRKRVKRHRDKHRDAVTIIKSNASETPKNALNTDTDTDTDTDTEEDKENNTVELARLSGKDTIEIFEYWQAELNHPQSKCDPKRTKAIKARLKEGYTVERIKQAIRGIKKCPHNMGQNDRNQKFDDIELICRSGANVDRFADAENAKRRFAGQERYENALLPVGGQR